jgi:predicted DNA-binding transcriptional regulator YafY
MGEIGTLRQRLLCLYRMMTLQTDEAHPLPLSEIIARLGAAGIPAERKTLYEDFAALRQAGFEIQYRSGAKGGWFLTNRPFSVAELRLLVDTVQAARFLTPKKSEALIQKLTALASAAQAETLGRQVTLSGRVKTTNESVYENIVEIQRALDGKKAISFQYFRYNVQKEKELRRGGSRYLVSPKALMLNHENYYLVGYDHQHKELRHYRVDKMQQLQCLNLSQVWDKGTAGFSPDEYSRKYFEMYRGREAVLTLRCKKELVGVMLDRFGMELSMKPLGPEHVQVEVAVFISPRFWGWLFALGEQVELLSPYWAVLEYQKQLRAVLQLHDGFA